MRQAGNRRLESRLEENMDRSMSALLYRRVINAGWLHGVLLFMASLAWVATAVVLSRSAAGAGWKLELGIGAAALAVLWSAVLPLKRRLPALAARLDTLSAGHGLMLALALGVALRIVWVLAVRAAPSSDGLTYLQLAQQLAAGHAYQMGGTLAYWPPGYALFLRALLLVFPPLLAVPVGQVALSAIAIAGVYKLTAHLAGARAAFWSALLFALWPNLVALCATPEKELLVVALLAWAFESAVAPRRGARLLAGLLLGAATLVQPSAMLLVPVAALLVLLRPGERAWQGAALLVLGAALALAPWTARNYQVLHTFKLVSTNGGDNLYRANNPLATGGYTEKGEIDLSGLGELERDRAGKQLALAWMREHPRAFAALGLEKQLRFMGDDATGVYSAFRAQGGARSAALYAALKLGSNLWWLGAWLVLAALVAAGARLGQATFLAWGWLYLFGMHTVFESAGKYHVPMLWVPCILLGVLIDDAARRARGAVPRAVAARAAA